MVHSAGTDCLLRTCAAGGLVQLMQLVQIEQIVWQRWHTGVGDGEMMVEACSDGRNNLPQLPSLPSLEIDLLSLHNVHTVAKSI